MLSAQPIVSALAYQLTKEVRALKTTEAEAAAKRRRQAEAQELLNAARGKF